MKKPVQRLTDNELRDYPITNVVEGWFFQVHEISQGYYRVKGIDRWGRSISRDGIDPDELFNACRNDIHELLSNP